VLYLANGRSLDVEEEIEVVSDEFGEGVGAVGAWPGRAGGGPDFLGGGGGCLAGPAAPGAPFMLEVIEGGALEATKLGGGAPGKPDFRG